MAAKYSGLWLNSIRGGVHKNKEAVEKNDCNQTDFIKLLELIHRGSLWLFSNLWLANLYWRQNNSGMSKHELWGKYVFKAVKAKKLQLLNHWGGWWSCSSITMTFKTNYPILELKKLHQPVWILNCWRINDGATGVWLVHFAINIITKVFCSMMPLHLLDL